jgi:hypothetical protein
MNPRQEAKLLQDVSRRIGSALDQTGNNGHSAARMRQ